MEQNWFQVSIDPTKNLHFVEQIQDELDRNHGPKDTKMTNEGRMYELTGEKIYGTNHHVQKDSQINCDVTSKIFCKIKTQNSIFFSRSTAVSSKNISAVHLQVGQILQFPLAKTKMNQRSNL